VLGVRQYADDEHPSLGNAPTASDEGQSRVQLLASPASFIDRFGE
jgi:hypothetical protein